MTVRTNPVPEQAFLLQLLRYDPETGKLYWRPRWPALFSSRGRGGSEAACRAWNKHYAGTEALAAVTTNGHLGGKILGQNLSAHRVIFKMLHGYDPPLVDHDNGCPTDNRANNLFDRDRFQNGRNCVRSKANKSGVTGVCWYPQTRRWKAFIRGPRGNIHLGYFLSFDDAVTARKSAETALGYHPNHGRAAA